MATPNQTLTQTVDVKTSYKIIEVSSVGKGTLEVNVVTGSSGTTKIESTSDVADLIKVNHNDKATLQIDAAFPEGSVAYGASTVGFLSKAPAKAVLTITVPNAAGIQTFTLNGNVVSLDWKGPTLEKGFSATTQLGTIKASALTANSVFIKSNAGSIELGPVKAGDVSLETNLGEIKSSGIEGFKQLLVKNSLGSINLDLTPSKNALADLNVATGAITAIVRKYEGKVSASTTVGSTNVTGSTVVSGQASTRFNGGCEGYVGREGATGSFKATSAVGAVSLQFI